MAGPFKLRSGNSPLFKNMGSPYHQKAYSRTMTAKIDKDAAKMYQASKSAMGAGGATNVSKHDYSMDPWPKGSYVEEVSMYGGDRAPDASTYSPDREPGGLRVSTTGWHRNIGTNLWRKYKKGFGPQSQKKTSKGLSMKDFPIGSKARHKEYERRGWAHDKTSKIINK